MNFQNRVISILTNPRVEWGIIADEPTDVSSLYKDYIVLLSAIPAACGFIGIALVGINIPSIGPYRSSGSAALSSAIIQYLLSLVGIYVAAFIIDKLALNFQSSGGLVQALKMVAYALTPSWIAGVLGIFPELSALSTIAGLYGIYLFYLGLPQVMKTPSDKVIPYTLVSVVVIIVVSVVVGSVSATMAGLPRVI